MIFLILVGIFIWFIKLENKVKELSDKNKKLERELHSYETLLESIEHEIEDNYSRAKSNVYTSQKAEDSVQVKEQENINTKTEANSQVQEIISDKQTHQNNAETNKENTVNKAITILQQQRNSKKTNESVSKTEPIQKAETSNESNVDKASAVEEKTHQNNFEKSTEKEETHQSDYKAKKAFSEPKRSPKPKKPQTPKEPISFVQVFSWIGGFILLLGIIFWIKYALENNIISPDMRVALGTIAGIGLWIAGALLKKPEVKTTSDTLCACGLCTCYSAWFAAYYFYHITPASLTFVLLSLVAIASFATAVWKNAQYIGVLAQVIGYVTPFLFPFDSTQIWFLLAYAAIINIAAIAAALKRDWQHQLYTGLAFTFLSFLGIINSSEPIQLYVFAAVFIMLYTAVAVSKNNTKLMHCSFVFAFIGLLILGLKTYTLRLDSLPYIISFAALFAIGFGLISSWKKNNELCFATLGFAFAAFVLVLLQVHLKHY